MAINPGISLQVQTPNIAPALNIFENVLMNKQTRDIRGQQAQIQAEQAPLQSQILQQQIDAGNVASEQADNQRILKSINDFAVSNQTAITRAQQGDTEPLLTAMLVRRDGLIQRGENTDHTDEGILMLGQGDVAGVVGGLKDSVNLFNQQSGRGQSAGTREFNNLVSIAQDPNATELERNSANRALGNLERKGVVSKEQKFAEDEDLTGKVARSQAEIEGAKSGAKEGEKLKKQLAFKPLIAKAVTLAQKDAASRGESLTDLKRMNAAMPGLIDVVDDLKRLAPLATSTFGGKIFDAAVKETGFGSTKGGTARAKFIATINNQVLPLLRLTFGSAFTEKEGESLKKSMSDPDATVESKLAQLDAFITQKQRNIEALELEVGADEQVIDFSTLSDDELFN